MTPSTLFLRDIWYYALPGHQLKSGRILVKTLLNESILFGRQAGVVFALRDFCPDQMVDQSGQCDLISSLTEHQTAKISQFNVKTYPVREVQGNLWIYMANHEDTVPSVDAPQVPDFVDRAYQAAYAMKFQSDIDHAVVGLIDPAHIAFVHRSWWWRSPATLKEVVKTFEPSFHGFTMQRHRLEAETLLYRLIGRDPEVEISFRLPGIRIERLSTDQHKVCSLTTTTPISETETEVTTLLYTTLPWFPRLKPLMLWFMQSFLEQDRKILAKQQASLQFNPALTLVGDADAQARWYYRLKKEYARAIAENRPFVNPVQARSLRWRS